MLTIAIGDIHGCLDSLDRLIKEVNETYPKEEKLWIYLGDYIDRGPNSKGVLDFIMDQETKAKVVALLGNHDRWLVDTFNEKLDQFDRHIASKDWMNNGGQETLLSFGIGPGFPNDKYFMPDNKKYFDWLQKRPVYFDDGKNLFVHAGVKPNVPLSGQTLNDLIWIRRPFLTTNPPMKDRTVIHGHTLPKKDPEHDGTSSPITWDPIWVYNELRDSTRVFARINIDTGCYLGGYLTALVFNNNTWNDYEYVTVKSELATW